MNMPSEEEIMDAIVVARSTGREMQWHAGGHWIAVRRFDEDHSVSLIVRLNRYDERTRRRFECSWGSTYNTTQLKVVCPSVIRQALFLCEGSNP